MLGGWRVEKMVRSVVTQSQTTLRCLLVAMAAVGTMGTSNALPFGFLCLFSPFPVFLISPKPFPIHLRKTKACQ